MCDWLNRGALGEEPYASFALAVEEARAKDVLRNQLAITKAATSKHEGDWKAAAWNLERKYPREYGRAAEINALPQEARPYSPWLNRPAPDAKSTPKRLDS